MSESIGPMAAPLGVCWEDAGAIDGGGLIAADEGGLSRLGPGAGCRGQGLRRDDEWRDLGQGPARARGLARSGLPTRARSETVAPLAGKTDKVEPPGAGRALSPRGWSRRSGSLARRTGADPRAASPGERTVKLRASARNRIFGLLARVRPAESSRLRRLRQPGALELLEHRGMPAVGRDRSPSIWPRSKSSTEGATTIAPHELGEVLHSRGRGMLLVSGRTIARRRARPVHPAGSISCRAERQLWFSAVILAPAQ